MRALQAHETDKYSLIMDLRSILPFGSINLLVITRGYSENPLTFTKFRAIVSRLKYLTMKLLFVAGALETRPAFRPKITWALPTLGATGQIGLSLRAEKAVTARDSFERFWKDCTGIPHVLSPKLETLHIWFFLWVRESTHKAFPHGPLNSRRSRPADNFQGPIH